MFQVSDPGKAFINYYGTMGNLVGFGAGKAFGNPLKATAIQTAASIGTNYLSNKTIGYANGAKR